MFVSKNIKQSKTEPPHVRDGNPWAQSGILLTIRSSDKNNIGAVEQKHPKFEWFFTTNLAQLRPKSTSKCIGEKPTLEPWCYHLPYTRKTSSRLTTRWSERWWGGWDLYYTGSRQHQSTSSPATLETIHDTRKLIHQFATRLPDKSNAHHQSIELTCPPWPHTISMFCPPTSHATFMVVQNYYCYCIRRAAGCFSLDRWLGLSISPHPVELGRLLGLGTSLPSTQGKLSWQHALVLISDGESLRRPWYLFVSTWLLSVC